MMNPGLEPQSKQRDVRLVESRGTAIHGSAPSWMPDFADDQEAPVHILRCDIKLTRRGPRYLDAIAGVGDRHPCGRRCACYCRLPQVNLLNGTLFLFVTRSRQDV